MQPSFVKPRKLATSLCISLLGLVSLPASAAFTVYTDEASFLATSGPISSENFDSVTADIAASSAGTTIGDIKLSGNATIDAPTNGIDINGSTNVYFNTSYGGWAELVFNQPITSFGMTMNNERLQLLKIDFARIGPAFGEYHHIATYAAPDPYASNQSINGFMGFTSDVAFNRIVFSGTGCCSSTFAVDNVSYASSLAVPVPEPLSAALMSSGLIAVALTRRKQRATPQHTD